MNYIKRCLILILVFTFIQEAEAAYTSCVVNGKEHNCKVTVSGFTDENLQSTQLDYRISGETTKPTMFSNLAMYVSLSDETRSEDGRWSVKVHDSSANRSIPFPEQINKLTEHNDNEQKYLQPSLFIQTDKVQQLTANITANPSSFSRLSAASEILLKLNRVLHYDWDKFNSGGSSDNNLPTTENILRSGKGLCFEFSIVFVAAARSVGIPARIISGARITPGRAMSHAWAEIKLDDETWWPIEPQSTELFLQQVGYVPYSEYNIFDANSVDELKQRYELQRVIDKQWFDGGITMSKLPITP